MIFLIFLTQMVFALTVYIDPGHGGQQDQGALSHNKKSKESELMLKISKELFKLLNKDKSFFPYMIRDKDTFIPVFDRVSFVKKNKNSVFLSLHANFSYNSKTQGAEFYIDTSQRSFSFEKLSSSLEFNILQDLKQSFRVKESYKLAQSLLSEWKTKKRTPPLKQAPFFVLSHNTIPSVVIEVGFLSHPRENQKLNSPQYQKKIALFLYKGLKKYRQRQKSKAYSFL